MIVQKYLFILKYIIGPSKLLLGWQKFFRSPVRQYVSEWLQE